MKKMRKFLYCLLVLFVFVLLDTSVITAAEKQTIYNSQYVTFAPDEQAWTTNAGDKNIEWYEKGDVVSTGIKSSIREPKEGEHKYSVKRTGEIPVGWWEVGLKGANCCHNNYPSIENPDYHEIPYHRNNCLKRHYSGWYAYCADCEEQIHSMLIYMSREAAESIDYLDVRATEDFAYYYLCPFCNNLEQGCGFEPHVCRKISYNQYKIIYNKNTDTAPCKGYMEDSIHMYNNATEYEGEKVTPITHLFQNTYERIGYEFIGWNTKPNGTGESFEDGAEIKNLSRADWTDAETWTEDDDGIVILYAQWKKSESTLKIDPNGGTYNGQDGKKEILITGKYGSSCILDGTIVPPKGYTVTFEENGGNSIKDITSSQYFTEWIQDSDFMGKFEKDTYLFIAPHGHTDIVKANYELGTVTLPLVKKKNSSFGGWYYDSAFKKPAGAPGDTITPTKNITLYAQWVELTLETQDNYIANGGKGAVDLSWKQTDGTNKTYKVKQRRAGESWKQIMSVDEIGTDIEISKTFQYTGSEKVYTVPYTGTYTLTAYGAQGGGYGNYKGGKGGSVTAKVWLEKGEKLTYNIGGKNGYNGGGKATKYGNGGGMTTIVSDRQGTLLIAGGGGGAAKSGDGEEGGSSTSLRADEKSKGASGHAGGGAGYVGGNAGEYILHTHTDSCYKEDALDYIAIQDEIPISDWMKSYASVEVEYYNPDGPAHTRGGDGYADIKSFNSYYCHSRNDSDMNLHIRLGRYWDSDWNAIMPSWSNTYIPTNGNTKVNISFFIHIWGNDGYCKETSSIAVYDQNGTQISSVAIKDYYTDVAGYVGVAKEGMISIDLSNDTTSIYIDMNAAFGGCNNIPNGNWLDVRITDLTFTGGKSRMTICGYTEGQILSSKPAYGGSNYVNPTKVLEYSTQSGVRTGNGAFSIYSENVGFVSDNFLNDVVATDYAAPDKVSGSTVNKEALSSNLVKVSWAEPKDNGTEYYHMVESYLPGSSQVLCSSNVTQNVLISEIQGYYTVLDKKTSTVVTTKNGTYHDAGEKNVNVTTQKQYLHIAAVDKAGNISETVHIEIDGMNIEWKLYTEQLSIEEADNVYPSSMDKTWYVRADGETPFTLKHEAYMDGTASKEYQPNYTIYESVVDKKNFRNIVITPSHEIKDGRIQTNAADLSQYTQEQSPLIAYMYSYTIRSEKNQRLSGVQKFILDQVSHGKSIEVIPITGAKQGENVNYSKYDLDKKNGITLIGDGEGPVISGMELLEDRELINRNEGTIILNVSAYDNLSGVRDFYLEITNTDNYNSKTYTPESSGFITVEITKDEPLFSGDFVVEAYAVDNVGNETQIAHATTEFALVTSVKRILEPHEPKFKCGESGILTITTWGYADSVEVEFPEEFTNLAPDLNTTYDYTDNPQYVHKEELQFMVPLYTPENKQYTITVRAYKGDKKLENYPSLSTVKVGGTVLDDIRTRLR